MFFGPTQKTRAALLKPVCRLQKWFRGMGKKRQYPGFESRKGKVQEISMETEAPCQPGWKSERLLKCELANPQYLETIPHKMIQGRGE